MQAKSKAQQRLFGMVHAVQKGEMRSPSKKIRELAERVRMQDAHEFASTKQKGLPERKEEKRKKRRKQSAAGKFLPPAVEVAIEKWANPTNGLNFRTLLSSMQSPSGRDGAAAILERLLQRQGVQLPPQPQLSTVDGKPSNAGNNPLGTRAGGFGIQHNVERRQGTL